VSRLRTLKPKKN